MPRGPLAGADPPAAPALALGSIQGRRGQGQLRRRRSLFGQAAHTTDGAAALAAGNEPAWRGRALPAAPAAFSEQLADCCPHAAHQPAAAATLSPLIPLPRQPEAVRAAIDAVLARPLDQLGDALAGFAWEFESKVGAGWERPGALLEGVPATEHSSLAESRSTPAVCGALTPRRPPLLLLPPQGDVHHWVPLLDWFDAYLEKHVKGRRDLALTYPPTPAAAAAEPAAATAAAGSGGSGAAASQQQLQQQAAGVRQQQQQQQQQQDREQAPDPPLPSEALLQLLRVTALILEGCSNKHLYNSYEVRALLPPACWLACGSRG